MTVTASLVKELRESTGAGMMECKKALVEVDGNLEAAQELLRKRGQASAAKKSGRIAAEGRVVLIAGADAAVIVEVNCETDFVAKDDNFRGFAGQIAELALAHKPADLDELMALEVADSVTLEDARRDLVAKIGENVSVRRFELMRAKGRVGSYMHGEKIGVLVDVEGGDEALRRDLAMHIAASRPTCISVDDVSADVLEKERKFLTEQAAQDGKPPEILAKMVEGRLRKYLNEITLLGQSFVKDPDINIAKLLERNGATIHAFVRLETGEGIEKKAENFREEVQAQVKAQS
jgi:elongation factor Ts